MIEEIKQRILAKAAKISRYEQRTEQYRINRLFDKDQKKVYNEFNGQNGSSDGQISNAEESKVFWSEIWSAEKKHNQDADWLLEVKQEIGNMEQRNVVMDEGKVKSQCKKCPTGKCHGTMGCKVSG